MGALRPYLAARLSPLTRAVTAGGGGELAPLSSYGPSNPIYIAHRGGSMVYPENTTEGFAASFSAGNRALEMDVQLLSDSALGVMHDTTIDRTTTGTGNVSAQSSAQWAALAIDANTYGFNTGNLVPPLFPALASAYRGRAIIVPEAKVAGSGAPIVTALQAAGVSTRHAMVQSFILAELAPAIAAGYPAMILSGDTSGIAAAQAAGVTWAGISSAAADAVFTAWIAAGFKVVAYTVNRRWQRAYYLALGVSGFFSDDPVYMRASSPIATTDAFAALTWMPGMIALGDTLSVAQRGSFTAADKWSLPTVTGTEGVLQGWASPIKGNVAADDFTLDFKVQYGAANGGDTTRWCSVFLSQSDKYFADGVAPSVAEQGFHVLLRKSGRFDLYKRSTSAATNVTSLATPPAIADGEEVAFRIVMTSTGITIHRLSGGVPAYTLNYPDTDAAFRGGYLHLNRNGLACAFRDITIT